MRQALDWLYRIAAVLAALLIITVALLVLTQMLSRLILVAVPGVDDFAGYCLAGASFLALAPTLKSGGHIRVGLLIQRLGPRAGQALDLWSLTVGLLLTAYFAWACVDFVWDSYRFGEVNHGMLATPLWMPRLAMPVGLLVLAIAFLDEIARVLRGGRVVDGGGA